MSKSRTHHAIVDTLRVKRALVVKRELNIAPHPSGNARLTRSHFQVRCLDSAHRAVMALLSKFDCSAVVVGDTLRSHRNRMLHGREARPNPVTVCLSCAPSEALIEPAGKSVRARVWHIGGVFGLSQRC